MYQLLARLRQKSDIQKKIIALTIAGAITVIVLVTWIATFSFNTDAVQESVDSAQAYPPVQTLREQFGIFKASVTATGTIEE